jgi:hypothetical protein
MGTGIVTWLSDPKAKTIKVYYEGSDTLYTGYALCYNYDTTDNWAGVASIDATTTASTITESGTTAEGSQNEGKLLRVEKPATANLQWFAGVVTADYDGFTGPGPVDIYVPNGAIVPVRSYVSSTVGKHALAIQNGQYYIGNPAAGTTNGAAKYVAVTVETVNRSSTAGVCLARLCPDEFLYQSHGTTKLHFATAGTVDVAANFINVASSQTTGGFTGLWVRSETTACGNADTAHAIYGEANILGVAAGSITSANRFSLNIWGGTQTAAYMCGACAEVYEQDATLSSSAVVALLCRTQLTNAPSKHYMIGCIGSDGADTPDGLLLAKDLASIGAYASSGNAPALATGDIMIPIKIGTNAYYLVGLVDTGV